MSAEIVNLNKFRKAQEKSAKEANAEENKARFGRTKAEKKADERARKRAELDLDQHDLTDGKPIND